LGRAAVEGGITFFDTADTYSHGASEEATGRLLDKLLMREEAGRAGGDAFADHLYGQPSDFDVVERAAEQLTLGEEEIARLEQPCAPHPVLGHG